MFYNDRLILRVMAGSRAYGIDHADSDEDVRGVCIPPKSYLLGLDKFEQKETKEPDEVIYSLDKFMRLALQNNPNILEMLFTEDRHVLYVNDFGKQLLENRRGLLSKKVYKTFGGYALSQLKKMRDKKPEGKRAVRIEQLGYDSKNAVHLIRLLKMGIEILLDNDLHVYRPDRKYLFDIRKGFYSLQEIEAEAELLMERLDRAYERSILPSEPYYDFYNKMVVDLHERSLSW